MPGVFRLQPLSKAGNDLSCDDFWITPQQQSKFQIVQGTDIAAMASITCNSIIEVQKSRQLCSSGSKRHQPLIIRWEREMGVRVRGFLFCCDEMYFKRKLKYLFHFHFQCNTDSHQIYLKRNLIWLITTGEPISLWVMQ